MTKGILMTIRLVWLVSVATGVLIYFQYALPIKTHMYLGFIIAFLMTALAILGLKRFTALAAANLIVAILLPVIGIVQLTQIGRPGLAVYQVLHVIIGVASIALAEILGKRINTAA